MTFKQYTLLFLTFICCLQFSCSVFSPEYERWNPAKAEHDAERDIETGKIKICFHGGYVPFPIGISGKYYDLIKDLPIEEAGVGCVVEDQHLRNMQGKYAKRYNKRILKHLLENSNNKKIEHTR